MNFMDKLKKLRDKINARRLSQGLAPRQVTPTNKLFEEYAKTQNENKSNNRN